MPAKRNIKEYIGTSRGYLTALDVKDNNLICRGVYVATPLQYRQKNGLKAALYRAAVIQIKKIYSPAPVGNAAKSLSVVRERGIVLTAAPNEKRKQNERVSSVRERAKHYE